MNVFRFSPKYFPESEVLAYLHVEIEDHDHRRPAVIVCPGGGYTLRSNRESTPIAKRYWAAGYQTFVLTYPLGENAKNFQPLLSLAAAVAEIRENSDSWGIATDQIAVCGFSAGGHLAASLGTLFNDEKFLSVCKIPGNLRPDAMILGYPVITADPEDAHQITIERVSGAALGSPEAMYFGLENHVDAQTPTAFLWTTTEDQYVPTSNTLKFAAAMSRAGVPYELHVFPYGLHGMGACSKEVSHYDTYIGRWIDWSIQWLNRLFDFAC